MELYIEKDDITKKIKINKPTKLKEILKDEKIILESVILIKNDKVCLEDAYVNNEDKIKLLSVVSGG